MLISNNFSKGHTFSLIISFLPSIVVILYKLLFIRMVTVGIDYQCYVCEYFGSK